MLKPIKHFIAQSWLLIISAFVFGLLIAVAQAAWQEKIDANKSDKLNNLMQALIPAADRFQKIDTPFKMNLNGKQVIAIAYKAKNSTNKTLGFCFNAEGPGFADKIELVIAVDAAFEKIASYSVLTSNETPGFGDQIQFDYYRNQFKAIPAQNLELTKTGDPAVIDSQIIAISGATVSSDAVVSIFNNYIEQMKQKFKTADLLK